MRVHQWGTGLLEFKLSWFVSRAVDRRTLEIGILPGIDMDPNLKEVTSLLVWLPLVKGGASFLPCHLGATQCLFILEKHLFPVNSAAKPRILKQWPNFSGLH